MRYRAARFECRFLPIQDAFGWAGRFKTRRRVDVTPQLCNRRARLNHHIQALARARLKRNIFYCVGINHPINATRLAVVYLVKSSCSRKVEL